MKVKLAVPAIAASLAFLGGMLALAIAATAYPPSGTTTASNAMVEEWK